MFIGEAKILQGNCIDIIKTLSDKSINCVITSPPYWQLRDYKWDGQWGLEPTFQMYLENLWSLMDEIWRVLKDDGTCWINLGDTYGSSSGGMKKDDWGKIGIDGKTNSLNQPNIGMNKCLLLLPHRFAIGCIERGWLVRNDIVWAKRNGMPESVTDRFSKKHEYFFLITKSQKYYFDLDSIRDKLSEVSLNRYNYGWNGNGDRDYVNGPQNNMNRYLGDPVKKKQAEERGKNPGSVSDFWSKNKTDSFDDYIEKCIDYWNSIDDFFDVCTQSSSDEHYAAYNDELIKKPILAGCPEDGVILDPFCGTATTGVAALDMKRNFIGIEGSEKYFKIATKNINRPRQNFLF